MNLSLIVDFFPNIFGATINNEDKLVKIQEPTSDSFQSTQSETQQEVSKLKISFVKSIKIKIFSLLLTI
jgi:hypothetical protein